ncbi:hypothetical protein PMIN01_00536 [Paraphaeosphaeria minitans]|uniref:Uncharacterized protein n=1 Tax=Paraphaeosphaeria minitans TaxID=565426 RepID=A0A9P6GSG3_9PLEO|nr:hypothetical protein PMIN01_00536 [Paraphaeosphaeria minitans]
MGWPGIDASTISTHGTLTQPPQPIPQIC